MGFRTRARARRAAQMDLLGSTRDSQTATSTPNAGDNSTPPTPSPTPTADASVTEGVSGVTAATEDTTPGNPSPAPVADGLAADSPVVPPALEVPEGTSEEIKNWVGSDVDRAVAAYSTEMESDKPRKGLLSFLENVAGVDNEDEEFDDQ